MLGLRGLVRAAARNGARREFQTSTVAALAKRECPALPCCLPAGLIMMMMTID